MPKRATGKANEDQRIRLQAAWCFSYSLQKHGQEESMNEKQKRTIHYSFKATPEEDSIIQQKMESVGIQNTSKFIRAMVLNGYLLKLDLPELQRAVRLMGSLSNNVNQIARRLHEGGSIYETEVDDIVKAQKQLQDTMDKILTSLDQIKR